MTRVIIVIEISKDSIHNLLQLSFIHDINFLRGNGGIQILLLTVTYNNHFYILHRNYDFFSLYFFLPGKCVWAGICHLRKNKKEDGNMCTLGGPSKAFVLYSRALSTS